MRRRAQAKVDAKRATSESDAALHNARQMAFKILANSMYGAMGSTMSKLPFRVGSESVTAIGRRDIAQVKRISERFFEAGATVVAGDTDSVMVAVKVQEQESETATVALCEQMGRRLVEEINGRMQAPKEIALEKVFVRQLIIGKKMYCGKQYETALSKPKLNIKGLKCVRRDGSALVRDVVHNVLVCLVETGDMEASASLARETLLAVCEDRVPLTSYAISKVLRKSVQDCCHPMPASTVTAIRERLSSSEAGEPQLSYAEQDEALQLKIKLPWYPLLCFALCMLCSLHALRMLYNMYLQKHRKWKTRLPQVDLAYRLRCKDPGSAPVPGQPIRYVVTNNGGKQLYEKVEILQDVEARSLVVDRNYYLQSLETPLKSIFMPLVEQRLGVAVREVSKKSKKPAQDDEATRLVQKLLWPNGPQMLRTVDVDKRRRLLEGSALMQCWAKQMARS